MRWRSSSSGSRPPPMRPVRPWESKRRRRWSRPSPACVPVSRGSARPAARPRSRVACRILDKFAVEPAPAQWSLALKPVHDLITASLADPNRCRDTRP